MDEVTYQRHEQMKIAEVSNQNGQLPVYQFNFVGTQKTRETFERYLVETFEIQCYDLFLICLLFT